MFENPRRGRQVSNFTTNVPKILDLKSSSEQIFFRKLSLGAPEDNSKTEKRKLYSFIKSPKQNFWCVDEKYRDVPYRPPYFLASGEYLNSDGIASSFSLRLQ